MSWKTLPASENSDKTLNSLRTIIDSFTVQPNERKKPIRLHLGDPSVGGVLKPCPIAVEALHEAIDSHSSDVYESSVGTLSSREAVVAKFSNSDAPFTADDVVMTSGCSHALQMTIEALSGKGDNILVPHPGFPLYATLCRPHGIEDRAYKIDMSTGDRIDLPHLETLIDESTKALIINNPGNPTGGVFEKEHLQEILEIANRHRLVVIADEIYGDLVFNGAEFHSLTSLSPKVPIIKCDGISKRWMVPGWRLGWLIVYDCHGVLSEVKKGIVALSQKIVGPCALVQKALPKILKETSDEYFSQTREIIQNNSRIIGESLRKINGLTPMTPRGAMYMMIAVDKSAYGSDVTFCQKIVEEESVFCLPGQAFFAPAKLLIWPGKFLAKFRKYGDNSHRWMWVDEAPERDLPTRCSFRFVGFVRRRPKQEPRFVAFKRAESVFEQTCVGKCASSLANKSNECFFLPFLAIILPGKAINQRLPNGGSPPFFGHKHLVP
ncbi:unnamed protein product [Caenorhabditis auriculariae]|uniref:Tyrosine aminotransferase n=1 Tax=Caenorhabditis auriculariae TaxID=2777116 RepID=A0A8S1GQB3_9PELO|nr:unnamed protein product [Caenorhabditis auriculariae]